MGLCVLALGTEIMVKRPEANISGLSTLQTSSAQETGLSLVKKFLINLYKKS